MTGLGLRLRAAREAAGLTCAEAGEQLGVTQVAVSFYEREKRCVPDQTLEEMSVIYGVPLAELAGDQLNLSARTRQTLRRCVEIPDAEYKDFILALFDARTWE